MIESQVPRDLDPARQTVRQSTGAVLAGHVSAARERHRLEILHADDAPPLDFASAPGGRPGNAPRDCRRSDRDGGSKDDHEKQTQSQGGKITIEVGRGVEAPPHDLPHRLAGVVAKRCPVKGTSERAQRDLVAKSTYAQVCNTIRHRSLIDSILNYNSSQLRKAIQMDSFRSVGLVYVLLYELLFGKYHSIRGGGKVKRCIMKFSKQLHETKCKVVKDDQGSETNTIPVFPRYVRINKLKATMKKLSMS